jgi:hypothetical protein
MCRLSSKLDASASNSTPLPLEPHQQEAIQRQLTRWTLRRSRAAAFSRVPWAGFSNRLRLVVQGTPEQLDRFRDIIIEQPGFELMRASECLVKVRQSHLDGGLSLLSRVCPLRSKGWSKFLSKTLDSL